MEPDGGTTNIRNVKSKHWTRWLGAENRCAEPFSFSETTRPRAAIGLTCTLKIDAHVGSGAAFLRFASQTSSFLNAVICVTCLFNLRFGLAFGKTVSARNRDI
jgi:hypothetical protein